MTKSRKYKSLHKILFLKEDMDDGKITSKEFELYLTKIIVKFQGIDDLDKLLKENIIDTLKGIKMSYMELSHSEIRRLVLELMGDVDRG